MDQIHNPLTPDPSSPKRERGEEEKSEGLVLSSTEAGKGQERLERFGVADAYILLAIAAGLAATLVYLGRVWWCGCGAAVPWSWDINTRHNSQHLLDPYTFSHVQHGLLLFWLMLAVAGVAGPHWRWFAALLIEACWEVIENTPLVIERYRAGTISLEYYGDSIFNSLSDLTACAAGYVLARWVGWRWGLAIFVAIELSMVALIRDSLLLNVLMLFYPLEAVKNWQGGA